MINCIPHVCGLKEKDLNRTRECDSCEFGKNTRAQRKSAIIKDASAANPSEHVYTDVVRPMKHMPLGSAKYFAALLESFSGFLLVRFLDRKGKAGDAVISIISEIEKILNSKTNILRSTGRIAVNWLRSDGGREYIGDQFTERLDRCGSMHETTIAYSSESNRCASRLNRTLLHMDRTMIINMRNPRPELWAKAINIRLGPEYRFFFLNRLITRRYKEKSTGI